MNKEGCLDGEANQTNKATNFCDEIEQDYLSTGEPITLNFHQVLGLTIDEPMTSEK